MSSDSHCFSCDIEISTKKGREKLELLTKSIDQKTVLLGLMEGCCASNGISSLDCGRKSL